MSSPLLVLKNGNAPETTFAMDRAVIRVGYGSSYDIPLPGEANQQGLVATLRRGPEGTWRVYRRGETTIVVDGNPIEADGQSIWKDGQTLVIDERLTLRHGESPATQAVAPATDKHVDNQRSSREDVERNLPNGRSSKPNKEPSETEPKDVKKSNTAPLVVLGMCGLLIVSIGFSKMKKPAKTTVSQPSLGAVLAVAEQDPREETSNLLANLKIARASLVRGDQQTAFEQFTSLRQKLSAQRERFEREQAATELEAIRYLEHELDQLR